MVTNGAIITGALDYVNSKAEKLVSDLSHKHKEVSQLNDKHREEEEDKTINDVF